MHIGGADRVTAWQVVDRDGYVNEPVDMQRYEQGPRFRAVTAHAHRCVADVTRARREVRTQRVVTGRKAQSRVEPADFYMDSVGFRADFRRGVIADHSANIFELLNRRASGIAA